jgi:hypothetical protein
VDYHPLGTTGDLKYRNGGRYPVLLVVFWTREDARIRMGPFFNSIPVINSGRRAECSFVDVVDLSETQPRE